MKRQLQKARDILKHRMRPDTPAACCAPSRLRAKEILACNGGGPASMVCSVTDVNDHEHPSLFQRLMRRWGWTRKARWCPVCARGSRRFRPAGVGPRADARCPHCGALERHRLVWLYLARQTDLFDGRAKKVLHIAPEKAFAPRLAERLGEGYITADLLDPRAMVKMDITDIAYPDQTFDVVYCSHVLEHVPDDRRALGELHRVLKDDGWAIITVPITAESTHEDPSIVDPRERLKAFGQEDHVRRYGPDFLDRLRAAGFRVKVSTIQDLHPAAEQLRMGLSPASGEIFHCTKQHSGGETVG